MWASETGKVLLLGTNWPDDGSQKTAAVVSTARRRDKWNATADIQAQCRWWTGTSGQQASTRCAQEVLQS